MELPFSFLHSSILFILLLVIIPLLYRSRPRARHPPGPQGWPIIGNMLDLGTMPHRTLAELAKKYGPVIWLKLGSEKIMVIQTAKAATDFFKNHDHSFVDRNINETMRVHDYHQGSLILAPYGPHWRLLKKLLATKMLASERVRESESVREKCVEDLIRWIDDHGKKAVDVGRIVFLAEFNLFGNLMVSKDIVEPGLENGSEFFRAMSGVTKWVGTPNVADFFPWLRWMDLQGLKKKMEKDMGKVLETASAFVKERRMENEAGIRRDRKDMLDVLLEFEGDGNDDGPQTISNHQINATMAEFLMAGTESTASIVEWALTELLANPNLMSEVKHELDQVVGPQNKFKESNIVDLPYLQAVIKETFRLNPPVPFLVPRKAVEDVTFMGYNICRGTQVYVNTWAIGRDQESWDDPLTFKPERFIGSKKDYRGQDYELLPFGAGRRMCTGISLAHLMLHHSLGAVLHSFDWEMESGSTPETIDWDERMGMTAKKLVPLKAIARKRKI